MKKEINLDATFNKALAKEYELILSRLHSFLKQKDNCIKADKIEIVRDKIFQSLSDSNHFKFGKNIGKIDPYVSELVKAFSDRKSKSKTQFVSLFFTIDFPEIRQTFARMTNRQLCNARAYRLDTPDMLKFLADYFANCIFLNDTITIKPKNEEKAGDIIAEIHNNDLMNYEDFGQFAYSFEGINNINEPPKNLKVSKANTLIEHEFTTARQVLAMHYMFKALGVTGSDKTEQARFIQFMNCRELNAKTIQNTNIYDRVRAPFSLSDKQLLKDLQFIRKYFESVNLSTIVKEINAEIEKHK